MYYNLTRTEYLSIPWDKQVRKKAENNKLYCKYQRTDQNEILEKHFGMKAAVAVLYCLK